jgi:hypothetical protein
VAAHARKVRQRPGRAGAGGAAAACAVEPTRKAQQDQGGRADV